MNVEKEKERIWQKHNLNYLSRKLGMSEMVTVCCLSAPSGSGLSSDFWIQSALIPEKNIGEILKDAHWDFFLGDGKPSASTYYEDDGELHTVYYRYNSNKTELGLEPLVIYRNFGNIKPKYLEISEEFRLFHDLFYEPRRDLKWGGKYIKIDEDGEDTVVATVSPNQAQIRKLELRQFLVAKEMHLSVQFECREYSQHRLEDLGLPKEIRKEYPDKDSNEDSDDSLRWSLFAYNDDDSIGGSYVGLSRLVGKRLIPPLPKS